MKVLLPRNGFVHCSRDFVHFNLYPAIEQHVSIDASAITTAAASDTDTTAPLPTKPFSQQGLLDSYRTRCSGPSGQDPNGIAPDSISPDDEVTWGGMWLDRFLSRLKAHSGPLPAGEGRRWRMGNGMHVMRQAKQAIVVSTPFISADVRENERAAYAALLLFRPHNSAEDLMTLDGKLYTSAVDLLRDLPKDKLAEDGWGQIIRVEQTAEESRELEELCRRQDESGHALVEGGEVGDDDAPLLVDIVMDDTVVQDADANAVNGAPLAQNSTGARKAGIIFGTPNHLNRARNFVADQHKVRQQSLDAEMREFDDAIASAESLVGTRGPQQALSEARFNQRHVDKLRALHAKANAEQLGFLDCVHATVSGSGTEQNQVVFAGEAGTGKSMTIEAAALFTRMLHGSGSVMITAPTNTAASLIQGVTINKAFHLSMYGKSRLDITKAEGLATIVEERERLSKIMLLIIDEKSLVGLRTLATVLAYIRTVFAGTDREHLPFGGIRLVVLSGDFAQLPPVKQPPLYRDPPAKSPRELHDARAVFKKFNLFFELKENYRQRTDPFWAGICRHARFHTAPSAFELARINARPRVTTAEALLGTPGALSSEALFTAWTRREVGEINDIGLAACNRRGHPTFTIWATHTPPLRGAGRGRNKTAAGGAGASGGGNAATRADGDGSDDDGDGGSAAPAARSAEAALAYAASAVIDPLVLGRLMLYNPNIGEDGKQVDAPGFRPPPCIKLAVGSRVRLAMTSSVILGLTKGAIGTVFGFLCARDLPPPVLNASRGSLAPSGRNPPWGVPVVLVQWDQRFYRGATFVEGTERVTPVQPLAFEVRLDGQPWTRCMLPLEPATASTIHAAQGMGADEHVVSPPDGGPAPLFYVQISRSTTLAGTHLLRPLTEKDFTRGSESDEFRAIQTELERLRKLPKWTRRAGAAFL